MMNKIKLQTNQFLKLVILGKNKGKLDLQNTPFFQL